MITNVSLVTIWVKDQDQAKKFYTEVLGFIEGDDIAMGDGFRWVTVHQKDHPELEITLMVPGPPLDPENAEAISRALDNGRMHALGISTDDCRKTHGELVAKGVEFIQEPEDRPYGIEAILRDNSGNWLVLVENKEYTAADFGDA